MPHTLCNAVQQNIVLLTCATVVAIVVSMYHSHALHKICNIASWSLMTTFDWFIVHICTVQIMVHTVVCLIVYVLT